MKLWTRTDLRRWNALPKAWIAWGAVDGENGGYLCLRLPLFSHESRYVFERHGNELGWWIPIICISFEWVVTESKRIASDDCRVYIGLTTMVRKWRFWIGHERHGSMAAPEDQLERHQR